MHGSPFAVYLNEEAGSKTAVEMIHSCLDHAAWLSKGSSPGPGGGGPNCNHEARFAYFARPLGPGFGPLYLGSLVEQNAQGIARS